MIFFITILFVNLLNGITAAESRIPEYNCDTTKPVTKCDLKDVRLTAALPVFRSKPVADPLKVKSFEVQSRSLPKLVAGICQGFPNLEKITIGLVDLEEIAPDAFSDCYKLTEVNIFANKLHHLDENLFRINTKLKTVYISSNLLEEIPVNLFKGLTNLRRVQLPGQMFTSISPEVFKDLSHLQILDLSRNHLRDLDVEKLIRYTPELFYIWLRDNDFKCSRLREVMTVLKKAGVTLEKRLVTSRERNYIPQSVDGVECLTDVQFNQLE